MSGTIIPLLSRRQFDFSTNTGATTVVIAKAVDVGQWTSGLLVVRVHSATMGSGNSIVVKLYKTAPTGQDPATDFEDTATAVASAGPSTTTAAAGDLETAALSANFGGFLQCSVVGTRSTGSAIAEISAELVVKD